MTGAEVLAAARRNLEARRAMVAQLAPKITTAREKAEKFRGAKNDAGRAQAAFKQMQDLTYIPGFFPTPPAVIARMLAIAGDLDGLAVLEPSAGRGDIAAAARDARAAVYCIEQHFKLAGILRGKGFHVQEGDFLTATSRPEFEVVLMNPPFERLAGVGYQDEAHTRRAWEWLAPGGVLVAVVGAGTGRRLEGWADEVKALPEGSFKTAARPTGVSTCLVIKRRPNNGSND